MGRETELKKVMAVSSFKLIAGAAKDTHYFVEKNITKYELGTNNYISYPSVLE
jgi:hypothetical protein